ncbi:hypothetical protein TNCV_1173411 [Trichonephila clavipes]|uniref:Secreted protein n=1 Tax=Trichonephila clavipes TaxID=2585209 RepID=A0A8X6VCZ6_TRICX|nr:hypothetical protein TNCV_1173411 [Trichonephila clavipes]
MRGLVACRLLTVVTVTILVTFHNICFPPLPLPATTFRCTPRHGAFFCRWGRCTGTPPYPTPGKVRRGNPTLTQDSIIGGLVKVPHDSSFGEGFVHVGDDIRSQSGHGSFDSMFWRTTTRKLLARNLVTLNHYQMTRTTLEVALFHLTSTPMDGRLSLDRFNVHPPLLHDGTRLELMIRRSRVRYLDH